MNQIDTTDNHIPSLIEKQCLSAYDRLSRLAKDAIFYAEFKTCYKLGFIDAIESLPKDYPTVKQRDAAVLREGLSWCFKHSPPPVQQKIFETLKIYALKVGEYCECTDRADLGMGNSACLDCGKRQGPSHVPHDKNPIIDGAVQGLKPKT